MSTVTTNYSFIKPAVNSSTDEDLWGTEWNTNADSIDTDLYAVSQATGGAYTSVASGTPNIGVSATANVLLTGTTTVTAFDTVASGITRYVRTSGIVTITHNGTSLICPNVASFTTIANSTFRAVSLGSGNWVITDFNLNSLAVTALESFVVACSDETTALAAGTAKVTFRMPYALTVTAVRASLTTAQTSGNIFTVDINESGTTILSTKLTIDNTELTSTTAVTPPVISDTALADDASMTVDIDQIGDGTAKGLKITILGYRPQL